MLVTYKYCLERHILRNSFFKNCFCTVASTTESIPEKKTELKKQKSAKLKLAAYFKSEPHLSAVKKYIPEKYFALKHDTSLLDSLYLIDSVIAKDIVRKVLSELSDVKKQVICETNAGLGLISLELLDSGINLVRLYECCPEFRNSLKVNTAFYLVLPRIFLYAVLLLLQGFNDIYSGQVELFTKNLFYAYALSYLDKIDNAHRVDELLQGIPKKEWNDGIYFMILISTIAVTF